MTALTSFNEQLYFLMKIALECILEAVRLSMQTLAACTTSVIYGLNGGEIFHDNPCFKGCRYRHAVADRRIQIYLGTPVFSISPLSLQAS